MKKFLVMMAIVAVAALSLSADVYIKTHTSISIMNQDTPAREDIKEEWLGDNTFVTITADQTMIIDLKKSVAYIIMLKSKTYVETPLPIDYSKIQPPALASFSGLFKTTATVAPTTETKKIGSWNCTGYDANVTSMGITMKMRSWVTTEVPFDYASFNVNFFLNMLKARWQLDDASIKEFAKMKGYQIASEMTGDTPSGKIRIADEVIEITKKPAPAGTYTIPAGFTKTATLSMDAVTKR